MREKLNEIGLRLTEISTFLNISRPTLYKYMEYYDKNKRKEIDYRVLQLFDYITSNPNSSKQSIIHYIYNYLDFNDAKDNNTFLKSIQRFDNVISDSKREFILDLIKSNNLDEVMGYLKEVIRILNKAKLNDDDIEKIGHFIEFKTNVLNNKKLTKTKIEKMKKEIERI